MCARTCRMRIRIAYIHIDRSRFAQAEVLARTDLNTVVGIRGIIACKPCVVALGTTCTQSAVHADTAAHRQLCHYTRADIA